MGAILGSFDRSSSTKGTDFDNAVDRLLTSFCGDKLSVEEKERLRRSIQQHGTAKALFDWLSDIALKKTYGKPTAGVSLEKSRGAAMYEQMVSSGGGYSRRKTKFLDPPLFQRDQVAGDVVKYFAEKIGVPEDIQQNLTSEKIQADVEKFIRDGDQHGLINYVQKFLNNEMPEEFAEVPALAEKWRRVKDEEARYIADKLDVLVQQAWGQVRDCTVATTARDLIELMSKSVSNLWVKGTGESLIDEAVATDRGIYFEWSKKDSVYTVVEKDGKFKSVANKVAMSEIHETHVRKILERQGFEVVDVKLPGNTGIDILAVKKNADGAVASIWVVECKATGQESVKRPRLSKTKVGKQLESGWIAEKMRKMYQQGGQLREAAILMRKNLDKIKTVVAFQKDGLNSWAHQDVVPEFDHVVVGELLKKENWY